MDQETMLHHLEELAERLGITVRYEAAAGRVGICMLRGERVAVVDGNLRVPDRAAALASVLAGEELNGVYIAPEVRRRLERSSPLRVRPGRDEAEVEAVPPDEISGGDESASAAESAGQDDADENSADPEVDAD